MRRVGSTLLGMLFAAVACAATDDRISATLNGGSLSGTNGGIGEAVGWIHAFDADLLASAGVEHQNLYTAQWTFGSLLGSVGHTWGTTRFNAYGEAHEGAGTDGPRHFHYQIEALGVSGTFFSHLTALFEDRELDVPPTRGNLPKVSLAYLWNPRWLTTASFSSSVSGNLGTHLGSLRADHYASPFNMLGGIAYGRASPTVLNVDTGLIIPGQLLKEVFIGFSKPFPRVRGELTVVGDYLDLAGSRRATLTLSYIFHIGGQPGAAR